jgi:uncharacterized protein with PIN domain
MKGILHSRDMKFLCDQMLARLGKWLRAAGHDTAIAGREQYDGGLLDWAQAEERILLTCSRRLEKGREEDGTTVVVLNSSDPELAAPELTRRLGVDWQYRPFTRCLEDNAPLRPADAPELAKVPTAARDLPGPVMACPACGRVYWPGSHFERMQERLAAWQTARA